MKLLFGLLMLGTVINSYADGTPSEHVRIEITLCKGDHVLRSDTVTGIVGQPVEFKATTAINFPTTQNGVVKTKCEDIGSHYTFVVTPREHNGYNCNYHINESKVTGYQTVGALKYPYVSSYELSGDTFIEDHGVLRVNNFVLAPFGKSAKKTEEQQFEYLIRVLPVGV